MVIKSSLFFLLLLLVTMFHSVTLANTDTYQQNLTTEETTWLKKDSVIQIGVDDNMAEQSLLMSWNVLIAIGVFIIIIAFWMYFLLGRSKKHPAEYQFTSKSNFRIAIILMVCVIVFIGFSKLLSQIWTNYDAGYSKYSGYNASLYVTVHYQRIVNIFCASS